MSSKYDNFLKKPIENPLLRSVTNESSEEERRRVVLLVPSAPNRGAAEASKPPGLETSPAGLAFPSPSLLPAAEPDLKQIPLDGSVPLYNPQAVESSLRSAPPVDHGRVAPLLIPHTTKRSPVVLASPAVPIADVSHTDPAYFSLSKNISTCHPSLVTDSSSTKQPSTGSLGVESLGSSIYSSSSVPLPSLPPTASSLLPEVSLTNVTLAPLSSAPCSSLPPQNFSETFSIHPSSNVLNDSVPLYPSVPAYPPQISSNVQLTSGLSSNSDPASNYNSSNTSGKNDQHKRNNSGSGLGLDYTLPSYLNPLNLFKSVSSPFSSDPDSKPPKAQPVVTFPRPPENVNSNIGSNVSVTNGPPSPSFPSVPPPIDKKLPPAEPLPPPPLAGFQSLSVPLSSLPKIHHSFTAEPDSFISQKKAAAPSAFKPEHYFTPIQSGDGSFNNLPISENLISSPDAVTQTFSPVSLKNDSVNNIPITKQFKETLGRPVSAASSERSISSVGIPDSAPPSLNPLVQPSSISPYLNPSVPPYLNPSVPPYSNPSVPPYSNPSVPPYSNSNPSVSPSLNPSVPPYLNSNPSVSPSLNSSVPPYSSSNPSVSPSSNPSIPPYSNPSSTNSFRRTNLKRAVYAPAPDIGVSHVSRPPALASSCGPPVKDGAMVTEYPQNNISSNQPVSIFTPVLNHSTIPGTQKDIAAIPNTDVAGLSLSSNANVLSGNAEFVSEPPQSLSYASATITSVDRVTVTDSKISGYTVASPPAVHPGLFSGPPAVDSNHVQNVPNHSIVSPDSSVQNVIPHSSSPHTTGESVALQSTVQPFNPVGGGIKSQFETDNSFFHRNQSVTSHFSDVTDSQRNTEEKTIVASAPPTKWPISPVPKSGSPTVDFHVQSAPHLSYPSSIGQPQDQDATNEIPSNIAPSSFDISSVIGKDPIGTDIGCIVQNNHAVSSPNNWPVPPISNSFSPVNSASSVDAHTTLTTAATVDKKLSEVTPDLSSIPSVMSQTLNSNSIPSVSELSLPATNSVVQSIVSDNNEFSLSSAPPLGPKANEILMSLPPSSNTADANTIATDPIMVSPLSLSNPQSNYTSGNVQSFAPSAPSEETIKASADPTIHSAPVFQALNFFSVGQTGEPQDSQPTGVSSLPHSGKEVGNVPNFSAGETETTPSLPPGGGRTYHPVYHHWFYKRPDNDSSNSDVWLPFSMADSLNLEENFSGGSGGVVATDGGRYDVDVGGRQRTAVYWVENPTQVRRCSWFVRGHLDFRYQPYDENVAALLEEEYRICMEKNEWNSRVELSDGEVIVMHGPHSIVHHQPWPPSPPDPWTGSPGGTGGAEKPRIVKRGLDEFDIPEGEPAQVDHLLFIVHGIGKVCDWRFRSLVQVVDDLRNISLSLVGSHFKGAVETGNVGRVEVLPVQWHRALHTETMDRRLADITLPSIPKARQFTNDTLLDILFYTSPVFCEKIVEAVGVELNRVYELFLERNPGYNGGVSLGGHSLGSIILFDLLCHQKPQIPLQTPSFSSPSFASTIDEVDDDDMVSSVGCLKARAKLSRRMSYLTMGTGGTGQPYISYPQLPFQPKAFFALGSPIGMFITVRGIESLGQEFRFPTCSSFFNIFHPNDPVAYRVEALIDSTMATVPPVLVPHHKGRKRMHLELKETVGQLTAAVKQHLVDSVKNTWASWSSTLTRLGRPATSVDVNQIVEDEIMRQSQEEETDSGVLDEAESVTEDEERQVGALNSGRRIDYVLQEAPLETFNQYISAIRSHQVYWESEDTILLILKEIYQSKGVSADRETCQSVLPVDLSAQSNTATGTAYTHFTVPSSSLKSHQTTVLEEDRRLSPDLTSNFF